MASAPAYAVLDGLFQQSLLAHLSGSATALDELSVQVHALMPLLLARD